MPADTQSETMAGQQPAEGGAADRDEWIAAVERIISEAEAWATEQHWFTHRGPKTITGEPPGPYEVPTLLFRAPAGKFALEPMGRYIIGATGEIELSVFPSYWSVLIIRDDDGWHFVIDPPTRDRPWSKEAFLEVVADLAKKA